MCDLIDKADIYAVQIHTTVAGRVVDARLERRLERLLRCDHLDIVSVSRLTAS